MTQSSRIGSVGLPFSRNISFSLVYIFLLVVNFYFVVCYELSLDVVGSYAERGS